MSMNNKKDIVEIKKCINKIFIVAKTNHGS